MENKIFLLLRTWEQIKKISPEIPEKATNINVGIQDKVLNLEGIQIFVSPTLSYQDFCQLIKQLAENPISEKAFETAKNQCYETL